MKLQEGPLFGALIIGAGIGYLIHQKTQNAMLAVLSAIAITAAGYILEITIKSFLGKKK